MIARFMAWLALRINDRHWANNMIRARRWRRGLGFEEREAFDDAFRPRIAEAWSQTAGGSALVIAYPDAIYEIKIEDLERAMWASAIATEPFQLKEGQHAQANRGAGSPDQS